MNKKTQTIVKEESNNKKTWTIVREKWNNNKRNQIIMQEDLGIMQKTSHITTQENFNNNEIGANINTRGLEQQM